MKATESYISAIRRARSTLGEKLTSTGLERGGGKFEGVESIDGGKRKKAGGDAAVGERVVRKFQRAGRVFPFRVHPINVTRPCTVAPTKSPIVLYFAALSATAAPWKCIGARVERGKEGGRKNGGVLWTGILFARRAKEIIMGRGWRWLR